MNLKKADKARKPYVRPILTGAAIFTILVLHFAVSQFITYEESVKDVSVTELINKQSVGIEPENEAKYTEAINMTDAVSPSVQSKQKIAQGQAVEKETETVNRKKAARESRAQRLRRAEKILTGI